MQNKLSVFWFLICLYYFVAALYALYAYPFWHMSELTMPFVLFGATLLMFLLGKRYFKFRHFDVIVIALIAQLLGFRGNLNGVIESVIKMLPFFTFIFLKDEYKSSLYSFLRNAFVIMLAISLTGWTLHLLGFSLPYYIDEYGWSDRRNDVQYVYQNYWVFLLNMRLEDLILNRFSCIFLEPGYLGCLMAVFLYLEKFNMKKISSWIFLLSLIMTFSVAGYVIALFAFVLPFFEKSRHRVLYILVVVVVSIGFYEFFSNYNQGENPVNELILERLFVDDSGNLAGYNRTDEAFDRWFAQDFVYGLDVVFGNHQRYLDLFAGDINVGWKYYVANFGLVGLIFYLYYLFFLMRKRPSYRSFVLFMVYLLIFARGHFFNFSSIFMILYYVGIYNQLSKNEY